MASVENLSVEVASRLNAVVPEGVRVEVSVDTNAFAIFSNDGWWGTQGFAVAAGERRQNNWLRPRGCALGDPDTLAHVTNGAWPARDDGELPIPWAAVNGEELQFGFGRTLVRPPIPLAAL